VITTALSTVVDAPRHRVWRALVDPAEIVRWDERAVCLLEPVAQPLASGSVFCWRYLLGGVPVVLREETLDLVAEERLHSGVSLGLFHFEQTYTLADEAADAPRTRLSLRLASGNAVPVVGGHLDRFEVRRQAAELVDARLRALQTWCEGGAS
jgi:uncharacterized protein YndB with AHSA1/START domain